MTKSKILDKRVIKIDNKFVSPDADTISDVPMVVALAKLVEKDWKYANGYPMEGKYKVTIERI